MALSRPLRLVAVAVVVAAVGLGACGDDESTGTPSSTNSSTTGPSSTGPSSTSPSSTSLATTTTAPAGRVAEFAFRGGTVSGDSRVTVKLGEQLTLRVVSDVAEEVHVHTYDLTVDLVPDVPGELTFTADIPGVHEVELEDSHLHLFSLEVE